MSFFSPPKDSKLTRSLCQALEITHFSAMAYNLTLCSALQHCCLSNLMKKKRDLLVIQALQDV